MTPAVLYRVQDYDARIMASRPATLLSYEPGCGKTAAVIDAAARVYPKGPWYIVTVRNALEQWQDELARWGRGNTNYTLTSYERAAGSQVAGINAGVVIVDECHKARNIDTVTFKSMYPICRQPGRYGGRKFTFLDTGTPVCNGVVDLFGQLVLAGIFELHQFANFAWTYCAPQRGGLGSAYDYRGAQNLPALKRVLDTVMIRRTYPEFGFRLPPIYFSNYPCNINLAALPAEYHAMVQQFKAWSSSQAAGSNPPLSRYTTGRRLLSLAKVPTVEGVARQQLLAGHNMLVFSEHRETVERLHKAFPGSGLVIGGDSPGERVQTFEASKAVANGHAVFATRGALGAAMNMLEFDRVGYVDLGWDPADFDQTWKRIRPNLQKRTLEILRFYVPNDWLDDFIIQVQLRKEQALKALGLQSTGGISGFGLHSF